MKKLRVQVRYKKSRIKKRKDVLGNWKLKNSPVTAENVRYTDEAKRILKVVLGR